MQIISRKCVLHCANPLIFHDYVHLLFSHVSMKSFFRELICSLVMFYANMTDSGLP